MENLEEILKSPHFVTSSLVASVMVGYVFGKLKSKRFEKKLKKRIDKKSKEYFRVWKNDYLPKLALNLTVRDKNPEKEIGPNFQYLFKIPSTFNPSPILLAHYFQNNPESAKEIYSNLIIYIKKYKKLRKN